MKSKRCKVLLIYHGAALEPSRRIFNALAMHKEIKLRVLGPRRGFNSMRNLVLEIPESKYDNYELVTGQVYKAMKDFSGPYLTGLMREIIFFRPDIIHVFNEAYSLVNFQAILYRNIFLPFSKCFCLGVDNIISMKAATRKERFKRNFVHKNSDGVACWSKSARDALKKQVFLKKS